MKKRNVIIWLVLVFIGQFLIADQLPQTDNTSSKQTFSEEQIAAVGQSLDVGQSARLTKIPPADIGIEPQWLWISCNDDKTSCCDFFFYQKDGEWYVMLIKCYDIIPVSDR